MFPDDTTLKRCKTCGETKPRAEFHVDRSKKDGRQYQCITCRTKYLDARREKKQEYDQRYYAENREKRQKNGRQYYKEHRDEMIEKQQQRYSKNRDSVLAQMRQYRADNREARAEYNRKYDADHREEKAEYQRRYHANNPDVARAYKHRRRARKTDNGGSYTADDLAAVRAAQTDKRGRLICWLCGKPIKDNPHLDHFIPLKHGGQNSAGNLHYTHAKCNLTKNAKLPTEIGRLI
jgi:hypothetical protein